MATNYEQFAQQANTATERMAARPTPTMFDFQPKQAEEDKFLSREEVKQALANVSDKKQALDKLVQGGFVLEGFNDKPQQAVQQPQQGWFLQGVSNIGAGIAGAGAQAVGGTLGMIGDFLSAPFSEDVSLGGIFTGENKGGVGQFFRNETERQLKSGAESFGAQRESGLYKGAKFGAGLGLAAATPGGVLGNIGKASTLGKIGLGATQGAIETGKLLGLTEGRLGTAGELGTGAAFGAALPIIGSGLGKAKEYVTQKLPENLISTGIATPSKLLNASERLNKLWDPSFTDATSASKWLLANKISGSLDDRAEQLASLASKAKGEAQNLLKSSKEVVSDEIASEAKKGLNVLLPKLEAAGLDDMVKTVKDSIANKYWTAKDLNNARTFLADKGKIFQHSGEWVDSLQKEALQNIWLKSSKYLDEAIPGFRAANKNYEVASALGESIGLKSAQDQARQLINLVNLTGIWVGGTIGGIASGGDPLSILKGAAIGAGSRYIFSPSNMSKLAVKLAEYAPKSEVAQATSAIEQFVKSRGATLIPKGVSELISKATQKVSTANPFRDLKFLGKLSKGEVTGLSKKALSVMKGVKSYKDALEKAKSAGVEEEIRKAYFGTPKYGGKPVK